MMCYSLTSCLPAAERKLLEEAVKLFPTFDKLHLMRGQLEERAGNRTAAKAAYSRGIRACTGSTALRTSEARLEEKEGHLAQARALLEQVMTLTMRQ